MIWRNLGEVNLNLKIESFYLTTNNIMNAIHSAPGTHKGNDKDKANSTLYSPSPSPSSSPSFPPFNLTPPNSSEQLALLLLCNCILLHQPLVSNPKHFQLSFPALLLLFFSYVILYFCVSVLASNPTEQLFFSSLLFFSSALLYKSLVS